MNMLTSTSVPSRRCFRSRLSFTNRLSSCCRCPTLCALERKPKGTSLHTRSSEHGESLSQPLSCRSLQQVIERTSFWQQDSLPGSMGCGFGFGFSAFGLWAVLFSDLAERVKSGLMLLKTISHTLFCKTLSSGVAADPKYPVGSFWAISEVLARGQGHEHILGPCLQYQPSC